MVRLKLPENVFTWPSLPGFMIVFFAASAVVDVAVDVPRLPSSGDRGGPISLVWNGLTIPSKPDTLFP
jgi:hypothetical protein